MRVTKDNRAENYFFYLITFQGERKDSKLNQLMGQMGRRVFEVLCFNIDL